MRKTLTVAVAALAIGLTGCARTPDNANTTKYPQEAKDNFVNSCTNASQKARPGDEKAARDTCHCIIDKIEASLPYDRKQGDESFKDADMAVKDGKPLPSTVKDDFDKATADCRK
jgi:hypothetical protein